MKEQPNIFNFLITRDYVAAFDKWAQTNIKPYSRRSFAHWAKVASPNFLTLVIGNKRHLTGDWLEGFIVAAKLPVAEAQHLRLISQFENTKDQTQKIKILEKIQKSFANSKVKNLAADQLQVLTDPAAWVIYHMLDLEDQERSLVWFKNRLRFYKLKGPEIQNSLDLLARLNLIEPKGKAYKSKEKYIESPDQIKKGANHFYHKNVLAEASEALDVLEPIERAFGSLTATVSREKIEKLKEEINQFGQHLLKTYASSEQVDGEVMRINIQLYPLTRKEKTEN
jgi:uncharacterized protein (TIGR02147 family)